MSLPRRGLVLIAALVLILASTAPAAGQGVTALNPKLDCTWLNADGSWISVWRYKNPGAERVIPVGGTSPNDNYFTGTPAIAQNQGQFTTFLAAQTPQSTDFFTVTMPSTVTSITWNLSGNSVNASKPATGGSTCPSQPVPLTGAVPPVLGYALAAAVMAIVAWRRRSSLGYGRA